jgi:hypothetical protein
MDIAIRPRTQKALTRANLPSSKDANEESVDSVILSPAPDRDQSAIPQSARSGWEAPLAMLTDIMAMNIEADIIGAAKGLVDSQQVDGGWKENPNQENSDQNSSIICHVALTTFLRRAEHAKKFRNTYSRSEHAKFSPDEKTVKNLRLALKKSWRKLNRVIPRTEQEFLGALPERGVLKNANLEVERLHEALLGDSLEVRLEPHKSVVDALETLKEKIQGTELSPQPARGFWRKLAGVTAVGAGVALAATTGVLGAVGVAALAAAPVLAGVAAGWATASYNESLVHDEVLHCQDLPDSGKILKEGQPKSLVRRVYECGPESLKKALFEGWFGHTKVHHYLTYKQDQVTQFRTEDEEIKLNKFLVKKGQERLIDEEHGRSLTWAGYKRFQVVAAPSYVAALGAAGVGAVVAGAGLATMGLFAAGFAGPAAIYPLFSKYYHRYTHMSAKEALATSPQPIKAFLKTDASRFILRHHLVHHYDDSVNFNLMPGGDLMRGTFQAPTVAQEEEMRRTEALW